MMEKALAQIIGQELRAFGEKVSTHPEELQQLLEDHTGVISARSEITLEGKEYKFRFVVLYEPS